MRRERAEASGQTGGYRKRDWFVLGMFAGVAYSLWKNPAGCACATGCLVILLVLAGIALFAVFSAYWPWLLLVAVAVILARAWRDRARCGSGRAD